MYQILILKILTLFLSGGSFITTGTEDPGSNVKLPEAGPSILKWKEFSQYIQEFNRDDKELYIQYYPNDKTEEFLKVNIPYFSCPDKELEKTYYFRWWTFRKHINKTPAGFVVTEFLRTISYAGRYNTISCPAGHHFYEGRWLHDQTYLRDYAIFWFKGGGTPRQYSFWAPSSILAFASVHQDKGLLIDLLSFFDQNYREWEKSNLCNDGLFWQIDDRDGMEASIGGSGKRATINSYMYGDARAIAEIAEMAGDNGIKKDYTSKAEKLRSLILSRLWDEKSEFFKTLYLDSAELVGLDGNQHYKTLLNTSKNRSGLADVRELHGYTPWYFNIPESKHSIAWKHMLTKYGFKAPFGPTTAEQTHPEFKVTYEGNDPSTETCQWNGPSWPFSTSVTLKAMANLLRDYNQSVISKNDFVGLLQTYSLSHRRINEDGKQICWIDENLNPFTGDWLSRTMRLRKALNAESDSYDTKSQNYERGKDYNHSAFCDFIISDLMGIIPSMKDDLNLNPLVPPDYWDWFCLDNVNYHNKTITIVWDKDGSKYRVGKGFSIFVNGELRHNSKTIEKINLTLIQ